MPSIKSNQTAASPGGIDYQFLAHLPEDYLKISLQHHLALWENPFFMEGGDCSANPKTKQRPISSHKLSLQNMARMANSRLVWILELISKFQCGFREDQCKLDHLVRFEHFIRDFRKGKKSGQY